MGEAVKHLTEMYQWIVRACWSLVGLLCGRVVLEEDDVLQLLWSAIRVTSSQAPYHFYSDLAQLSSAAPGIN